MSTRATLIINPAAGGSVPQAALNEALAPHRWLNAVESQSDEHLDEVVARACDEKVEVIIAAGGDGTVNRVLNEVMRHEHRPTFAILPIGSANDFAAAMGIPNDIHESMSLLKSGSTFDVDLIRVRGRHDTYLMNAATMGLSVQIHATMDEDMKAFWGRFAYARAAASVIPSAEAYDCHIKTEDWSSRMKAHAVVVSNSPRAGGLPVVPVADPTDGWLDLVVVQALDGMGVAKLLFEFAMGRQLRSETVIHRRVREVTVTSEPKAPFIGDGDECDPTPVKFECVPGAIRMLAPPREAEAT